MSEPFLSRIPHAITSHIIISLLEKFLPPPGEAYRRIHNTSRDGVGDRRALEKRKYKSHESLKQLQVRCGSCKYIVLDDNDFDNDRFYIRPGTAYHFLMLMISFINDNEVRRIVCRYSDITRMLFGNIEGLEDDYFYGVTSAIEYRHSLFFLNPDKNPRNIEYIPNFLTFNRRISDILTSLNNYEIKNKLQG